MSEANSSRPAKPLEPGTGPDTETSLDPGKRRRPASGARRVPAGIILESFILATNAPGALIDRHGIILLSTPAFDQLLPPSSQPLRNASRKAPRKARGIAGAGIGPSRPGNSLLQRLLPFDLWPLDANGAGLEAVTRHTGPVKDKKHRYLPLFNSFEAARQTLLQGLMQQHSGELAAIHSSGTRLTLNWHPIGGGYTRIDVTDETSAMLRQEERQQELAKVNMAVAAARNGEADAMPNELGSSGMLAHDLRNTLTAANGHLGHLVEDMTTYLHEASTHADGSVSPAMLIQGMSRISDALAFAADSLARPYTAGRGAIPGFRNGRNGIEARQLIAEAARVAAGVVPANVAFSAALPQAGIQLRDHGLDVTLYTRAVLNLATNAFNAVNGSGDGRVELAAEAYCHKETDFAESDRNFGMPLPGAAYLRITIRDNGPGLRPALIPNLFKPGYSTRAPGMGSGIGLFSVAQLAVQAGGYITAKARGPHPWQGACFSLHLPLERRRIRPSQPIARAAAATGDGMASGIQVLIVDDDPAVAEAHAFWARRATASVSICPPEYAATAIDAQPPLILMVDRHLGESERDGGLALASLARLRAPSMVIILVSGDPPPEIPEAIDLVLQKPVPGHRLIDIIRQSLEHDEL